MDSQKRRGAGFSLTDFPRERVQDEFVASLNHIFITFTFKSHRTLRRGRIDIVWRIYISSVYPSTLRNFTLKNS